MISKQKLDVSDQTGGYIGATGYGGTVGVFFPFSMNTARTGGKSGSAITCRETLFNHTNEHTKHIGFFKDKLDIKKLNDFFEEIEAKIGYKARVTIYKCQYDRAVVVYVPPFWRSDPTRRSFFSLFLRCGGAYYTGDFKKALEAYDYIVLIRNAVNRFLAGNTVPTYKNGIGGGVVEKFQNLSAAQVAEMLRKPKQKKA